LDLFDLFKQFKDRGIDVNSLIQALISYRLTENHSIIRASDWVNRKEVLETFNIEDFEQRTLYRVLEIIGENYEETMLGIQDSIFHIYDFPHTNTNFDWTNIVLYGNKCPIGKRGYSRDHRPDKKQITVGVSELATPINMPIGMTIREGNINDQVHFNDTFDQVVNRLKPGSMVVFDQGANKKSNLEKVEAHKLKYVTASQINTSDQKTWIKNFTQLNPELVDD